MDYEERLVDGHRLWVATIENGVAGVYKIRTCSGVYIGSSKNIRRRLNEHIRHLLRNDHDSYKLQRAFNNCETGSIIQFAVIEIHTEYDAEKLFKREQHYIDTYKRNGHTLLNTYDTADTRKIMSLRYRYGLK